MKFLFFVKKCEFFKFFAYIIRSVGGTGRRVSIYVLALFIVLKWKNVKLQNKKERGLDDYE